MKPSSLAIKTSQIFEQFEAQTTHYDDYTITKTPSRPNYFWGNTLTTKSKIDTQEEFDNLIQKYKDNFDSHHNFITIAFDIPSGDIGDENIVKANGFKLYKNKVLSTSSVQPPPKFNQEFEFREVDIVKEHKELVQLHIDDNWYLPKDQEIPFLRSKFISLEKLHAEGIGKRFGAYIENQLVADLGIYIDQSLGRYNDVVTHKDFRRRGICGSLVYLAGKYALEHMNVSTLVMEADEDYHAARIYESVGFKHSETFKGIEWNKDKP